MSTVTSPAPAAAAAAPPAINPPTRLASLDALRGFDMFWIAGADDIVLALKKAAAGWTGASGAAVAFVATQLEHEPWAGFRFYDLIFPLFVFIVGVSLVFSLTKTLEQGSRGTAFRRIFVRALLLFVLGVIYSGGIAKGIENVRLLGVLQRIALCYFFAAILFCTFRVRGLMVAGVALLVGYWAMMTFIPVPGVGAGNFAEGSNLANWIDREYLPFRKYDGDHDPEGLLSTLPAIATCLLGVFAGLLLRKENVNGREKVKWLVIGGVASLALGYLWGLQFPIIKKIWTSSYVLVAGGWSCLLLAFFYQVVEVWRVTKWTEPFIWIGTNPITIYLVAAWFPFRDLANRIAGGPVKGALGGWGEVLITAVVLALIVLLARFMYRRRIFLRL
jgi:predicted acyltransferase